MRVNVLENFGKNPLEVTNSKEIIFVKNSIVGRGLTVIDDIIFWSSNKELVFIYFICVFDIF